jgi:eukaryotic-like serine/threonine-protein kinase
MEQGTDIGHYHVLRPLGSGGMGEVYLAEDTRLKRQVAVKVLPERLRSNEERLKRFRREAEAAASLKHPNIATIHSLEEIDDQLLIVMEHVEGHTLKEAIPEGGMELEQFFDTFIPLADALAHAHAQGRIHRDLKPANIMIAEDGTPKILDFGLASIIDLDAVAAYSDTDLGEDDATQTMKEGVPSLTRGGQLIGTPQYMSPEQAERKETDARTDIFSFGLVMYEAITGKRAFDGDSLESIIGRILVEEPKAVTELRPITPYTLWTVIRGCLKKNPAVRMQTAEQLREVLMDVQEEAQTGTVLIESNPMLDSILEREPADPPSVGLWRRPASIAVGGLLLAVIVSTSTWLLKPEFNSPLRKSTFQTSINGSWPAVSPDGTMIAYADEGGLWIRDLDQVTPRQIPGTEGAGRPFWSPSSEFVGYTVSQTLKKVHAKGGPSVALCSVSDNIFGATWSPNGRIVFSADESLFEVASQGGIPHLLASPDTLRGEIAFYHPSFLPDGRSYLAAAAKDDGRLEIVVRTETTQSELISLPNTSLFAPVYASSGYVIYQQDWPVGIIWAAPVSLADYTITGEPFPLYQTAHRPSVSGDATLVYGSGGTRDTNHMVLVDGSGKTLDVIGQPLAGLSDIAVSPDGEQVAVAGEENGNRDVWVYDIGRKTRMRLTFHTSNEFYPAWTPSGETLTFNSFRSGDGDLFTRPADGSEDTQPLITSSSREGTPHRSINGRFLAFYRSGPETARDVWYQDLSVDNPPVPLVQTRFEELHPQFSPDTKHLAYSSNESGRDEIYVLRFPEGEGTIQVSTEGGIWPRWSPRNDAIFFVEPPYLMKASLTRSPTLQFGAPERLFELSGRNSINSPFERRFRMYDVMPGADRFIVAQEANRGNAGITVVQNWFSEFKDRN